MRCPICGHENAADAGFCGGCGAPIQAVAAEPVTSVPPEPVPAPDASPPAPSPPPPPAPSPSGPPVPGPPAAQTPPATEPSPPRRSRAGLVVVIVIVLLLACLGCGTGGFLFLRGCSSGGGGDRPPIPEEIRHGTAQEAMEVWAADFYPGREWGFWVVDESPDRVEYFVGLMGGGFDKGIVVERAKGGWRVTEQYTPSNALAERKQDLSIEDLAALVVSEFIKACAEGRGQDAAEMTGPPISDRVSAEDWPDNFVGVVGYEFLDSHIDEDVGAVIVRVNEEYDDGMVVHSAYYLQQIDDRLAIVDISVD